MTEVLQISFDLHPNYDRDQHRLEELLKSRFGLECGDTGAGFGRRDLEFHPTRELSGTEIELLALDLFFSYYDYEGSLQLICILDHVTNLLPRPIYGDIESIHTEAHGYHQYFW